MIKILESAISDRDAKKYSNPADKALSQYVIRGGSTKGLNDHWSALIKRYKNDKTLTIYRGLNFNSKESYQEFVELIEEGKVRLERITSWSPDKSTAEQFSMTKPSYNEFMDMGKILYIQKQDNEKERITGYRGVILKTEIPAGTAVDVTKFEDYAENEILLPPGRYDIEIEEILTYKDTIGASDINEIILGLTKEDLYKRHEESIFRYLDKNFKPEDFSARARRHIYELTMPSEMRFEVEKDNPKFNQRPKITVYIDKVPEGFLKYYTDSQTRAYKAKFRIALKKALAEVVRVYEPGYKINWYSINPTKDFEEAGLQIDFVNAMKKTVGNTYNDLNSHDTVNRINSLTPGSREYKDAMDNLINNLKDTVGSVTGGYNW